MEIENEIATKLKKRKKKKLQRKEKKIKQKEMLNK